MTSELKKKIKKLNKLGWKITDYGWEDDPFGEGQPDAQFVIIAKDRNWFYMNLWPNSESGHDTDGVTISPHIDFNTPIDECSVTLCVDELVCITDIISSLHDIKELEE